MVMDEATSSTLVFFVNGKKIIDNEIEPEWTLLYYLRTKLRLCGTKLGCGEGGCGACTVMVSKYDRNQNKEVHLPVNACLAPVLSMHGLAVTTVEGIGSTKTKLHPVQERIAKAHGSQCGFCTPGIVMSMYTLLRNSPKPLMKELEVAFQGNLCRCTGYRPIIEGYRTFTEEWERMQHVPKKTNGVCGLGDKCCKVNGSTNSTQDEEEEVLFRPSDFTPYHPTQEPIFPPELKLSDQYDKEFLVVKGQEVTWYRPTSLTKLLELKTQFPDAKLVVGNTEIGVETKFKHMVYPVLIQPNLVPELTRITIEKEGLRVGSSTTLIDLEEALRAQIKSRPEPQTRVFQTIVNMLNWFAGKQIRSVGSIGSNIMTGSPISDMIPILLANKVDMQVQSSKGSKTVKLDENYFTGYRKSVITNDEVLINILIPFSNENQYCEAYKQARRREDDIAIVNAAVKVELQDLTIKTIDFGFGGMSFKPVPALKTSEQLKGLKWNRDTLEKALEHLLSDLPLSPEAPGGMIQYRRSLTLSLFFKAWLTIEKQLKDRFPEEKFELTPRELSGIEQFHAKDLKSSQYFTVVPETQEKHDALQRPIVHLSAYKQATGEAVYCDDIPVFEGELYGGFVLSTKPHANILKIDASKALETPGVHGFFSADDIDPKRNSIGSVIHDEKVFYSDKVTSQGQVIGLVVADTQAIAQKAARLVKVEYEDLEPVVITIEDAIKHRSFFRDPHKTIIKGDIDKVLAEAPHVITGECRMGGQEHFYLETQSVVAVPRKEDGEMDVYSSTQNPTECAKLIAEVLGVQQNKIYVKVKRLGGGFGGKESKAVVVATPIVVAANKLQRPVRCMLDRDEDIVMSGGRHPFLMRYKAAFNDEGLILGVDMEIYNNCGYSYDLSLSVLERSMTHFENSYKIPAVRVVGYPCKTNLISNTAFRGFGGPQGMYAAECILQDIAFYLKKDPVKLSELNLYQENDITYYNQKLVNCTLRACWSEVLESSKYHQRRLDVQEFNRLNRYKKRGLSVIPTKYGISFTSPFLNQAGALILVYTDGSILLSHGGTEMGQGLYTKMIQVASRTLGVPVELIHTTDTSTDKVPNTSPTAASCGSDLNGMAVLEACMKINDRLKPYKVKDPKGTWQSWVKAAYFDRVSLSATGFHKTPDIGYNWDEGTGNMFNYYTYGAACAEVEIDTLTGDHLVIRSDIVMDLGESLNPAIDIGQIEGAYVQGYGLFVMEEMMYSSTGVTYTRGPGTYKIPGFGDIPGEFNVSLLKGASNPRAVYSSKAVGEPPLFLASAVLYAIRDAIKAAREEQGITSNFRIDSPCTSAKIRMACQDSITSRLEEPQPGTFKPWNVIA